jgi:hypothetical protein
MPPASASEGAAAAIYPPDPMAAGIFNRLGTAVAVESADQFSAFSTATATIASYCAFAGEITEWLARHDVPRHYVATVFQGLANMAVSQPQHRFTALAPGRRLRRVECSPATGEGGPVNRPRARPTPSYNGPRSSPLA